MAKVEKWPLREPSNPMGKILKCECEKEDDTVTISLGFR
jgi:hypothetical protein